MPLTSLVFSPEGAALYAGTENGKVLVLDLRALDKAPKAIIISEGGQAVVGLYVQVSVFLSSLPSETHATADQAQIQRNYAQALIDSCYQIFITGYC